MKKDTLLALCSPDINRRIARMAINSIKTTNLDRAELMVIDNAYDKTFSHPATMNKLLGLAQNRKMNLVFLDDDVEIYQSDWLDRLYQVAEELDADIVSCAQTYPNGHINSIGEIVYQDGTNEILEDYIHDPLWVINKATYTPTLCSALKLVRNCHLYHIDTNYKKYKQDMDICMQAWQQGRKVGLALDLKIIHNRGFTGETNPNFQSTLSEDSVYFAKKWQNQVEQINKIPELSQYQKDPAANSWRRLYNQASRSKFIDPKTSTATYRRITQDCYIDQLVAGAHYHLYTLTKDTTHLQQCHQLNPCHRGAQKLLKKQGLPTDAICSYGYNCRECHLR